MAKTRGTSPKSLCFQIIYRLINYEYTIYINIRLMKTHTISSLILTLIKYTDNAKYLCSFFFLESLRCHKLIKATQLFETRNMPLMQQFSEVSKVNTLLIPYSNRELNYHVDMQTDDTVKNNGTQIPFHIIHNSIVTLSTLSVNNIVR